MFPAQTSSERAQIGLRGSVCGPLEPATAKSEGAESEQSHRHETEVSSERTSGEGKGWRGDSAGVRAGSRSAGNRVAGEPVIRCRDDHTWGDSRSPRLRWDNCNSDRSAGYWRTGFRLSNGPHAHARR